MLTERLYVIPYRELIIVLKRFIYHNQKKNPMCERQPRILVTSFRRGTEHFKEWNII